MNNLHCEHGEHNIVTGGSHWVEPSRWQRWWFDRLGFQRCFTRVIKEIIYILGGFTIWALMGASIGLVLMIVFAYFYARFIGDKGWLEWMWNLRRLWILGAGLLGLGYGVYYIISKQWVLWRKDGGK